MLMFIFAALLIAGAVGWFTSRRTPAPVPARPGNHPGPVYGTPGARTGYDEGAYGVNRQVSAGLADAEAEARHWVTRLGSGITALEGMNGGESVAARQSVAEAAERHASARRQLAEAYTLKQVQLSGRTAIEGLHYLRSARLALGLDAGPDVPQEMPVPVVQETRRVTVNDQEYVASSGPGEATPYYYPGGQVRGRMVPSGWYSAPWWKTAMVAGAAGIGSMLVLDALFDGMHGMHGHHGGGSPGGGGPGGFDGGGFDGDGFFGGDGFGF